MIGLLMWLAIQPAQPFPARLERAIEQAESGGDPWVKRGACRGLWQVDYRYASPLVRKSPALLYVPQTALEEGRRALAGWVRACGGDLTCGLRGFRCGWAGVRGECGSKYAAAVQTSAKGAHWSVDYVADHCRACPECCVQ